MAHNQDRNNIPFTDFYGESTVWPVEDLVHCEKLSLRSARFNWQIKPHRHRDLLQMFFVIKGQGSAQVDDRSMVVNAGDLLVIPENCVHMFRWQSGSDGYVLAIARPLIKKLEDVLNTPSWVRGRASLYSTGSDIESLSLLLNTINDEHASSESYRQLQMENQVLSLGIWITRKSAQMNEAEKRRESRSEQRLNTFIGLIERNFEQHHSVGWYSNSVGLTSAHLNEICKKLRNQTALSMIHQRLVIEAQRELIFTVKPASKISERLGFSDPAYFSRFFKRLTGVSPREFRDQESVKIDR